MMSLVTTGNSTKKIKSPTKKAVTSAVAVLVLLVLSTSIATCYAQSSSILAPTWMKEGTYANYLFYDVSSTNPSPLYLGFLNGSFHIYENVTSAVFRWECIKLDDNMATMNVSLSITSTKESDNYYNSTLLDVDIANRSVYLQNGTLIGTTHLWAPSSPADGQEIILWNVPPDKTTGNVTAAPDGQAMYTFQTSQGTQRFFTIDNIKGKINGKAAFFFGGSPWYEYDTGLMIQGTLDNEPTITALGIDADIAQSVVTNIDMGPPRVEIDLGFVLGLVAIAASIIILTVITIKRRRQRAK